MFRAPLIQVKLWLAERYILIESHIRGSVVLIFATDSDCSLNSKIVLHSHYICVALRHLSVGLICGLPTYAIHIVTSGSVFVHHGSKAFGVRA